MSVAVVYLSRGLRVAVLGIAVLLAGIAAPRAETGHLNPLFRALHLDEVMDIMTREGHAYAEFIEQDLFGPDGGGTHWDREVSRIYAPGRLRALVEAGTAPAPSGRALTEMTAFFTSPLGQRVIELEISARKAMLDPAIEETAIAAYRAMADAENPELERLRRFVEVNDLIEANVVGGLNTNLAFYRGLADGGGFGFDLSDSAMLADVQSQEPEIRAETIEWLFAYLSLAYHPLSDADLDSYTTFSLSAAGQAFNAMVFAGFDAMFEDVAYQLGHAAGQLLSGDDI